MLGALGSDRPNDANDGHCAADEFSNQAFIDSEFSSDESAAECEDVTNHAKDSFFIH